MTPPETNRYVVLHVGDATRGSPYFAAIATKMDRTRFTPVIGSMRSPAPFQDEMRAVGCETFALSCDSRRAILVAVGRLASVVRRTRASIVHAHGFDATLAGLLAARLTGTVFVFTRHHSDHHLRMGARWHVRIDGWCARHADRVIAVSDATRLILQDVEGVPPGHIEVVYNGVEVVPDPPQARVEALRQELCLSPGPVCLMVARLHEEKGHRFLLDALPAVVQGVGPLTVLFAGEGPDRELLEKEVGARGLQGLVRFLGWRADVRELMALSNVVVLTSLAESFGQVVTEAMSVSRPVVAFATGGVPELIRDGETGILVPVGDSVSLAAALSRVLRDQALARQLGQEGRRRAEAFSYDQMLRGYEKVYAAALSLRSR